MDLFERIRRGRLLTGAQLNQVRGRVLQGEDWASAICALKLAPERAVVQLLVQHTGYPGVDLSRSVVALANLQLVPKEQLVSRQVLPMVDVHGGLILAMANPDDARFASELGFSTGKKILAHVAVPALLRAAIQACLQHAAQGETLWRGKEAWKLDPGPAGRAAVVGPEQGAPLRIAAPEDDEPLQVIGLDEPIFASFQCRPPEPAPVALRAATSDPITVKAGVGVGKLALVVDDSAEMRALMVKTLEPFGCAILQSEDGKKALALARETVPDLVVLDAMLPGMHGFEVCRALKGDPAFRRTAVLMVSGVHTSWRVGVDVTEVYGADGFFEKPFRVDDFKRAVRRCLLGAPAAEQEARRRRDVAMATCREAAARARAGKRKEAIDLLQSAADQDPFSAEPHFYLGQLLRTAGDPYRAVAALERAVELRPDLDEPLTNLGQLYQQLGFRKSAHAALVRAQELKPAPRVHAKG